MIDPTRNIAAKWYAPLHDKNWACGKAAKIIDATKLGAAPAALVAALLGEIAREYTCRAAALDQAVIRHAQQIETVSRRLYELLSDSKSMHCLPSWGESNHLILDPDGISCDSSIANDLGPRAYLRFASAEDVAGTRRRARLFLDRLARQRLGERRFTLPPARWLFGAALHIGFETVYAGRLAEIERDGFDWHARARFIGVVADAFGVRPGSLAALKKHRDRYLTDQAVLARAWLGDVNPDLPPAARRRTLGDWPGPAISWIVPREDRGAFAAAHDRLRVAIFAKMDAT